jgi:hypothetical protein
MTTALSWVVFAPGCSTGGANSAADGSLATDGEPDTPIEKVDSRADADAASAGEARGPDGPDAAVDVTDPGVPDAVADVVVDAAQADLTITTSDACLPPPLDAAVDGPHRFLDLVVKGQGFEEHEGKRVYIFTRVFDTKAPLGHGSDLVRAGQFSIFFPNGYARFSYQPIFYYVDVNGDGRCDEATGDHPGLTLSNASNPTSNDPLEMAVRDNHMSMLRNERVCDLMNACN